MNSFILIANFETISLKIFWEDDKHKSQNFDIQKKKIIPYAKILLFFKAACIISVHKPSATLVCYEEFSIFRWALWIVSRIINPKTLWGDAIQKKDAENVSINEYLTLKSLDILITNSIILKDYSAKCRIFHEKISFKESLDIHANDFEEQKICLRQVVSEKKSILLVDMNLVEKSPTVKHFVYSIPKLISEGFKIRYWGYDCEVDPEFIEWKKINCFFNSSLIKILLFPLIINFKLLMYYLIRGKMPARAIYSTHGTFLKSDASIIQFWNLPWLKIQLLESTYTFKHYLKILLTCYGVMLDYLHLYISRKNCFIAVSEGIASEFKKSISKKQSLKILPNSYDESRFNVLTRKKFRDSMRKKLGFHDNDIVFLFASQGHYERKGFFLAFESLLNLKKEGYPIQFLIVGGSAEKIKYLQQKIFRSDKNWHTWVKFSGSQSEVEKTFSATDYFLFPSFFESYALVQAEAAAMGIPLFVTPFHGTEMVVKDGVNGKIIPWNTLGIVKIIRESCFEKKVDWKLSVGLSLTREEYSNQLLNILNDLYEDKA